MTPKSDAIRQAYYVRNAYGKELMAVGLAVECERLNDQHADDQKRIATLVDALRPFSTYAELWEEGAPDHVIQWARKDVPHKQDIRITLNDCRNARAALALAKGE